MRVTGDGEPQVFGVTELTHRIRVLLEGEIGSVRVEGEVSNLRQPASGHMYFTLKDENAQISAVLFRGNQRGLSARLQDGMAIEVSGDLSVYERSGNYQIIVRTVKDAGLGALRARFEKLKARLLAEGLFDQARKRPIPELPRHVGVVTSPTGAAIRDILNVIERRFPDLHVVIAPVRVQGDGAAREIARGIEQLNAWGGVDVLIVGRGGGSLEDLWAFNEEVVARAIADSACPVIAAVGHEIDFTIADFVADVRAPTPSAAAELVVERKDALRQRIAQWDARLERSLRTQLLQIRQRLMTLEARPIFREPELVLREQAQRLDRLTMRMEGCVTQGMHAGDNRLRQYGFRAERAVTACLSRIRQSIERYDVKLSSMNPQAVLERGYSIAFDVEGQVVRSARDLTCGDALRLQFAAGEATTTVDTVSEEVPRSRKKASE